MRCFLHFFHRLRALEETGGAPCAAQDSDLLREHEIRGGGAAKNWSLEEEVGSNEAMQ